jgi:hypothetical protein
MTAGRSICSAWLFVGGTSGSNRNTNLSKLNGGWVRVYRPAARADQPGQYKFSIVNNVSSGQQVQIRSGTQVVGGPLSLSAANTTDSYWWDTAPSKGPVTLTLSNGASVPLENAAGYEVYQQSGGAVATRKLRP